VCGEPALNAFIHSSVGTQLPSLADSSQLRLCGKTQSPHTGPGVDISISIGQIGLHHGVRIPHSPIRVRIFMSPSFLPLGSEVGSAGLPPFPGRLHPACHADKTMKWPNKQHLNQENVRFKNPF
jgi:hypothetical protein